eukprot:GHRR01009435.1.p1 GENE.GHRR01009435.1~~GHRR01009435.1.p1  ORF type:complete len:227 (+),score=43.93 GHRR01009435.1:648-1328(+)
MGCPFASMQQPDTMELEVASRPLRPCGPEKDCSFKQHAVYSGSSVDSYRIQRGLPPSSSCNSLTEHQDVRDFPASSSSSSSSTSTSITSDVRSHEASSRGGSNSSSSPRVHQAWQLKRPILSHNPKLSRRELRRLNRNWTLEDVAKHKYVDDGWIVVNGSCYDITEHVINHPGWDHGCQVTTVLSIIAHFGIDCSEEFTDIHRPYPEAWKQLQAYYIGDLTPSIDA